MADDLRREAVGDEVTYVVNRNINFTNVCYVGCRFCAFAQREVDPESYTLTLREVGDRAEEAWELGATEVCMQGGIHPDLPGDFYFRLLDAVKERVPDIHIHAFSPMEVLNGSTRLGISFREFLAESRRRGLGSIPGTAAEILCDQLGTNIGRFLQMVGNGSAVDEAMLEFHVQPNAFQSEWRRRVGAR